MNKEITRRDFMKKSGIGLASLVAGEVFSGCPSQRAIEEADKTGEMMLSFDHSGLLGDYPIRTVFWYPENGIKNKVKRPLIYISHGFASIPKGHIDLGKRLAGAGYIVAAPDHLGDKLAIAGIASEAFPNFGEFLPEEYDQAMQVIHDCIGSLSEYEEFADLTPLEFMRYLLDEGFKGELAQTNPLANESLKKLISYRLNESQSALEGIEKASLENEILKDRIDMNNIGLIGHSLGGYTVLGMGGCGKKLKEVKYDFSNYLDSINLVIPQSPVSGIFCQDEINQCSCPRIWMVGELDREQFNCIPEKLFREGTNCPEYFFRIDNGGHDIYDNLACFFGAGENIPQSLIEYLGENTFGLFSSETYLEDCSDYQKKQDLIFDYVRAGCDVYLKGDDSKIDTLTTYQDGILDLYFKK